MKPFLLYINSLNIKNIYMTIFIIIINKAYLINPGVNYYWKTD